jgi:hypothetical protein
MFYRFVQGNAEEPWPGNHRSSADTGDTSVGPAGSGEKKQDECHVGNRTTATDELESTVWKYYMK